MGKWEMVRLGEVCEVISGSTPSTLNPDLWDGDVKWIAPAEIGDDSYFIYDTNKHISEVAGLKPMPVGTVLLSSRAPIGKVAIAGSEMCCNQGFKNLVCSSRIHNRYLFRYLKSKTEYLNSLGRGATFKEISKSIVENIEIPLPPLPIQQKIADALDKASALIEMRKAQIEKLDLLIKSQFIEMFGDPVTNPKGWERKVLTDTCDQILGGGTPSKSNAEFFEGTIPWVSPKDMKTAIIWDSIDHISDVAIKSSSTKLVPKNSVLLVIRSGILKRYLPVAINAVPVTMNQDMKALIPNRLVTPQYLMYYIRSIEAEILGGVRAVTADNIDFNHFKMRKVIVPPILLQSKFSNLVLKVEEQRRILGKSLDELEQYNNSFLQKCFNGEMF